LLAIDRDGVERADEIVIPLESSDTAEAHARVRAFARTRLADPATKARERRAGIYLALEWTLLISATYALIYALPSWWLKTILLVPWSLYSGFALDNIIHYGNHWPLFRSRFANALWRYSGALVQVNPLEIRAVHHQHHAAYNRPDNAEQVFSDEDRSKSFARYVIGGALDGLRSLMPWRAMDPSVLALRVQRPARYREILALRGIGLAWVLVLVWLDWANTLFFFIPTVLVGHTFASLVMNLTDHIPGDSRHPFRLATYHQPKGLVEATCSAVNHHTCATHLTHHLFPRVHWVHLPSVQTALADIFERNAAPRSLLVNSALLGNPAAIGRVLREIKTRHFDTR